MDPRVPSVSLVNVPLVKVCGVTTVRNALAVAACGVDFIGLNFWPGSKRYVTTTVAAQIAEALQRAAPQVRRVGLFVNQSHAAVAAGLVAGACHVAQLHGDESAAEIAALRAMAKTTPGLDPGLQVWRVVPVGERLDWASWRDFGADALVVDTPSGGRGGSGTTFDWALLRDAGPAPAPVVLAGGLHAENVRDAVQTCAPWVVDVASGVERGPGDKDPARVAAFVAAAKRV